MTRYLYKVGTQGIISVTQSDTSLHNNCVDIICQRFNKKQQEDADVFACIASSPLDESLAEYYNEDPSNVYLIATERD